MSDANLVVIDATKLRALEQALANMTRIAQDAIGSVQALPEGSSSNPEGVGAGELSAMKERLIRVWHQLRRLHPLPTDKRRRVKSRGAVPQEGGCTAVSEVAAIRSALDLIEDRLAVFIPHRSSGKLTHKFHGRKRVKRQDGGAIRADFQRLGRDETFRKWCFDGERGFAGGTGEFTRRQVEVTLSHESGGHRRRRGRHLTPSDPPPAHASV